MDFYRFITLAALHCRLILAFLTTLVRRRDEPRDPVNGIPFSWRQLCAPPHEGYFVYSAETTTFGIG
jgi:hypothetical protein